MQDVIIPLHFDMNILEEKVTKIDPSSYIKTRDLSNGKKPSIFCLGKLYK